MEGTQETLRLAESQWAEIFCKTLCVKWLSLACRQEERKTTPNLLPVEALGKGKAHAYGTKAQDETQDET